MSYNIKTTHTEVIGNVETEIKTDAIVYEQKEVQDYISIFVSQFTEFADEGRIKIAVFVTNDYGTLEQRMFYTYEEGEMVSFNKDKGRPKMTEKSEEPDGRT